MQDIDFLPDPYRRKSRRRPSQPSHLGLLGVFAALLFGAIGFQHYQKRQVQRQLVEIRPQYELAMTQNEHLAEVSSQVQTAVASAELFTYLRHPWPRTRLLEAVLAPLPEEIAFDDLQIISDTPASRAGSRRRAAAKDQKATEAELAALPAAARDLGQLRDQFDARETVVRISGTTRLSGALHRYLSELGRNPLFSGAELESIETHESDADRLQFAAALVTRPGYGQPGGPAAPAVDPAMQPGPMPTPAESHAGEIQREATP